MRMLRPGEGNLPKITQVSAWPSWNADSLAFCRASFPHRVLCSRNSLRRLGVVSPLILSRTLPCNAVYLSVFLLHVDGELLALGSGDPAL